MSWSLRTRLTTWYAGVLLVVLLGGAVAITSVQWRLELTRLDAEMAKTALTVDAVIRDEFDEGAELGQAARAASTELVSPDRRIVVATPSGRIVTAWGGSPDMSRSLPAHPVSADGVATSATLGGIPLRVLTTAEHTEGREYRLYILAPLAPVYGARTELLDALAVAGVVALIIAAGGGWLVASPALRPLTRMAADAAHINTQHLSRRLTVPRSRDELAQLGEAFNAVLDRLATSLDAQRQFMADAAHQLRTPVSVVRTTAEVTMQQPTRSEQEYREALAIVGGQGLRLSRLVDAMFLLSRAEAGGRRVHRQPLYVDDLVGECVRDLRPVAATRGVRLELSAQDDVAYNGDEELLRQMFTNLLDNAVRYTRSGGRVVVDLAAGGDDITVRIRDQGPGIADADREAVFARFTRLNPQGDGAGLGLPIARWIAEAHGGRLMIESSSPDGTVFAVTLPLSDAAL